MKLLLVVLYLLLASATAALLRAVALVVAMALDTLGGICRRGRLSHLGDVERLPRADLVGGDVIALLEHLYTDAILLGDGVERLTCGDDVSCGCRLLLGFCLLPRVRRVGCSSSVTGPSSSLEDWFLVAERVDAVLLGPSRFTRSSGEFTRSQRSSLRIAGEGGDVRG